MADFPKITRSQRQGLLGIPILETFVIESTKCVLRETPQKVDVGIDGYIDIVEADDTATGRCLAFQLKCGPSFLKNTTPEGFIYYGESRHLNLFMNHPVPVIIILIDPETKKIWWQKFDLAKTEGTETGWKMIIPRKNECCSKTRNEWTALAGVAKNYLGLVSEEWTLKRRMKEVERVVFEIPRNHIESLRFDFIIESFSRLTSTREMIELKRNSVDFSISGYDQDPRELWQIPEVRRWWNLAEPIGKYWFYFGATDHSFTGLNALHLCIIQPTPRYFDEKKRRYTLEISLRQSWGFVTRNFAWLNEFTATHEIPENINAQISDQVLENLQLTKQQIIKAEAEMRSRR